MVTERLLRSLSIGVGERITKGMKYTLSKPSLLFSLLLASVLHGCVSSHLSKENAQSAEDRDTRDYCDEFDWYGDGECDTFCLSTDPDCASEEACAGENPAGCLGDGECPGDWICDFEMGASSGCSCDDGVWNCTPDVSAGTCVPPSDEACSDFCGPQEDGSCTGMRGCDGPNPAGCSRNEDCSGDQVCDFSMERSGGCCCDGASGSWVCTPDRNAGTCVAPLLECEGENPAGCLRDEDCEGEAVCDLEMSRSSACECMDGSWVCTPDVNAGTCVSASACEGENPSGCSSDEECDDASFCDFAMGRSSGCLCEGDEWVCTPDMSAGTCMPR